MERSVSQPQNRQTRRRHAKMLGWRSEKSPGKNTMTLREALAKVEEIDTDIEQKSHARDSDTVAMKAAMHLAEMGFQLPGQPEG
jgi:hypothetical protein